MFFCEMIYTDITDHDGCYHDKKHCCVFADTEKDTDICFFDLKDKIYQVINNSTYVKDFMDKVEISYDKT